VEKDRASALLGVGGVQVLEVDRESDGQVTVWVGTSDPDAAVCPDCQTRAGRVHERVLTRPRDLPRGRDRVELVWLKRRFKCDNPGCGRGTFTEMVGQVPARARVTERLREHAGDLVGQLGVPVSSAAGACGLSWPSTHQAFVDQADPVLAAVLGPVRVLGIDETRRGRPRFIWDPETDTWVVAADRWHTGFVDISGEQGLLGQVEGRTSKCVVAWLEARTPQFREAIRFVAIDPAAVYAKAITTPGLLPNATTVVDHFHIVKLANDCVTKVRRRTIWEQQGRRGRKIDPAWMNRRRLLTAKERLSPKAFAAMWNSLIDSDPSAQILSAWIAKEELRALLALARTGAHRDQIRQRLYTFYAWCADTDIDELHTLAATVETWWPAIEVFIHNGITNARTEGVNRLVKQVKRSACGFRNPTNSRRRIRFHCTRTARAAAAASRSLPVQS
jgi:transposase